MGGCTAGDYVTLAVTLDSCLPRTRKRPSLSRAAGEGYKVEEVEDPPFSPTEGDMKVFAQDEFSSPDSRARTRAHA